MTSHAPTAAAPTARPMPELVSAGFTLDRGDDRLGWMRDSNDALDDVAELRRRMADEGYLLLRGLLDRGEVLDARRSVLHRIADSGRLDPAAPLMEGVLAPTALAGFSPDLAKGNAELERVLYAGPMIHFFERFLGEPVRHYDYTWFRSVQPGHGTPSHCDVVYMGRGERDRLFTAWTPIGDVDFTLGGLMILEGSNNFDRLRNTYGQRDVDTYCTNRHRKPEWIGQGNNADDRRERSWGDRRGGWLGRNPVQIRNSLGGRWLTTEYQAGDVLLFSVFTVHASLDNRTTDRRLRLSSDSRYQPASSPADERWIGPNPVAHGPGGKRGRIC